MFRNLDRRVEVLFPVRDRALAVHLRAEVLETYLRDNRRARRMRSDGSYWRVAPREGEAPLDSHCAFLANVGRRGGV